MYWPGLGVPTISSREEAGNEELHLPVEKLVQDFHDIGSVLLPVPIHIVVLPILLRGTPSAQIDLTGSP